MRLAAASVLTSAVSALLVASSAVAGPQSTLPVSVGDTIDIVGTRVACFVVSPEHKKGIGCFLADSKGLLPGTFGAALAEDGEVIVNQANKDRTTTHRLFKRTLQQATGGHYYKVHPGDKFGFAIKKGTLGCTVINVPDGDKRYRGLKVACWLATTTMPFPKTYGISVSDSFAGIFRFDAQGNAGTNVFVRFQP